MKYICDYASDVSKAIGKGLVGVMVGWAALTGIDATLETKLATKPAIAQQKLEEITEKEIEELMKKDNAYKIMKPYIQRGLIKNFKHNETNPEQSLERLHKEIYSSNKPVLVLFYNSEKVNNRGDSAILRDAIIFNELVQKYTNKINFFCYDAKVTESNGRKNLYVEMMDIMKQKYGYFIRGPPSISMFSKFNLIKGETPNNNDLKIKHIDTVYGGPTSNKQIPGNLHNLDKWWIKTNVISPFQKKLYRFENSYKLNKYIL